MCVHTGGSDFIHEKYLQNTIKWDFKGIIQNVPAEVDEYLAFQCGDDWGNSETNCILQSKPTLKVVALDKDFDSR